MFQLEEHHKMVQDMVRQWCEKVLLPKVPAMEKGEELPYDLMRQMAQTFGLGAMAAAFIVVRRIGSRHNPSLAPEAPPPPPA